MGFEFYKIKVAICLTERHNVIGPKAIYIFHLISLNFRDFFLWYLAVLFLDSAILFDFYQNHMAFWPQTSSFSIERNFSSDLCRNTAESAAK